MRRAIFRRQQRLSTAQKKVTTCPFPCLTLLCFGSSFQTWSCTCFIVSYCFHRSQENLYICSGVWWQEGWYVYSMVFHSYKVKLSFFSHQQPALIQYTLNKFPPFAISTSKVSGTIFRYFFIACLRALPIPKLQVTFLCDYPMSILKRECLTDQRQSFPVFKIRDRSAF